MKIATWNVNGIRAREGQVRDWMAAERPDAVCLQEIKARPDQIPAVLFESEGYWCYWHGGKGYSGVVIASMTLHFFPASGMKRTMASAKPCQLVCPDAARW